MGARSEPAQECGSPQCPRVFVEVVWILALQSCFQAFEKPGSLNTSHFLVNSGASHFISFYLTIFHLFKGLSVW